jgi:hypothetical protein
MSLIQAHGQDETASALDVHAAGRQLRMALALNVSRLYKCKSLAGPSREYTLDIIENSRVYFPTPPELNDAHDCRPIFRIDGDPSDEAFVRRLLDDELRAAHEARQNVEDLERLRAAEGVPVEQLAAAVTQNTYDALSHSIRVFSASAEQHQSLLWSRYANGHRGLCLHFHVAAGSVFGRARQVRYSPQREPILIPLDHQLLDEIPDRMVLTKAIDWEYEKEFRIVWDAGAEWEFPTDEAHRVSFEPELLCGITLGMSVSNADRAEILVIAARHEPPITVWQARENAEGIRMDFEPVV